MSIRQEFHRVLNLDTDRFTKYILVKDVFDSSPAEDKIQEFGCSIVILSCTETILMFSLFLFLLPVMLCYNLCFRFFIRIPNYLELLLNGIVLEMVHSIRSSLDLIKTI